MVVVRVASSGSQECRLQEGQEQGVDTGGWDKEMALTLQCQMPPEGGWGSHTERSSGSLFFLPYGLLAGCPKVQTAPLPEGQSQEPPGGP